MKVCKCFWWRGENHVGARCRGDVRELLWIFVAARFFSSDRSLSSPGLPSAAPWRVRVPARVRWARRLPVRVAVPAGLCRPLRPGQRGVTSCGITIWQEGERLTRVPCCRVAHFLAPGLSPCFWGLVRDYRLQPEIRAFSSLLLATRDHRGFGFLESL